MPCRAAPRRAAWGPGPGEPHLCHRRRARPRVRGEPAGETPPPPPAAAHRPRPRPVETLRFSRWRGDGEPARKRGGRTGGFPSPQEVGVRSGQAAGERGCRAPRVPGRESRAGRDGEPVLGVPPREAGFGSASRAAFWVRELCLRSFRWLCVGARCCVCIQFPTSVCPGGGGGVYAQEKISTAPLRCCPVRGQGGVCRETSLVSAASVELTTREWDATTGTARWGERSLRAE